MFYRNSRKIQQHSNPFWFCFIFACHNTFFGRLALSLGTTLSNRIWLCADSPLSKGSNGSTCYLYYFFSRRKLWLFTFGVKRWLNKIKVHHFSWLPTRVRARYIAIANWLNFSECLGLWISLKKGSLTKVFSIQFWELFSLIWGRNQITIQKSGSGGRNIFIIDPEFFLAI